MPKKKEAKAKAVKKQPEEKKQSSTEILVSNLLEPGAMFKVTDRVKDGSYMPGSLGFISFIRGIDDSYQDIAKICAVMVRIGKTGKERIQNANLSVPIFYVDHKGFDKLLPGDGNRKGFVHIERELPMASDLMEMEPLYFLGHAVAISKRIKHMSDQCRHKKWPESKSHPINVLKKLPDYFNEDPPSYLESYTGLEFRENFILEARRMISSLIRVHIQLDLTRADTEINAAEFLLFTNKGDFIPKDAEDKKNEYSFTEDNDMLKRTVDYHKQLRSKIENLYKKKSKKKS